MYLVPVSAQYNSAYNFCYQQCGLGKSVVLPVIGLTHTCFIDDCKHGAIETPIEFDLEGKSYKLRMFPDEEFRVPTMWRDPRLIRR